MSIDKKTPVIWITWDEAHCDTLGYFGAATHTTPHVDGLAASSHNYMNAYTASPVCLPARCSMATGQYPHHNTSLGNFYGGSLRRDLPNVFSMMRGQQYKTAVIGKCHFTPVMYGDTRPNLTRDAESVIAFYEACGIDTLVLQDDKQCSAWFYDDYAKEMEEMGLLSEYRRLRGSMVFPFPGPESMHPDRWVADRALEHIAQAQDNEFIWISFSGPHYPIDTPQRYSDMIDVSRLPPRKIREGEWDDDTKLHALSYHGPGVTEAANSAPDRAQKNFTPEYWAAWQKGYRGNVKLLDDCMGDILAAVKEKWGDDVMIVFTADHGDMSGHHGIWAKNHTAYEDVIRVPLMVRLPGQTEGVEHGEWASNLDMLPTTLKQVFGIDFPCDGRDMVCRDGAPDYVLSVTDEVVAIVQDEMKLTLYRFKDKYYNELYDLKNDPDEFENVYGKPEYAQAQQRLMAILEADPTLLPRVFYEYVSEGVPYWMAPPKTRRRKP